MGILFISRYSPFENLLAKKILLIIIYSNKIKVQEDPFPVVSAIASTVAVTVTATSPLIPVGTRNTSLNFALHNSVTRACIQNKEMQERVDLLRRLFLPVFINTVWRIGGRYNIQYRNFLRVNSFYIHFPDFLYTHVYIRVGLPSFFRISIKSRPHLKNPRKPVSFSWIPS